MTVSVPLDSTLYPSECIFDAAANFSNLCGVDVRVCPTSTVAEFAIADGEERIVDEFLNYLLMRSVEDYLMRIATSPDD